MNDAFNPDRAGKILADSITSVFADMAFIDVERKGEATTVTGTANGTPIAAAAPRASADSSFDGERRAAINVLSPLSCRIELKINTPLRDRILETLFGDSMDQEQKKSAEDPLLEMLNIIAGSFLSSYFGSGTNIQLELPRYLYLGEESPGQSVSSIAMDAEGEPLEAFISSVRYRY
jgi:hypothetical protein